MIKTLLSAAAVVAIALPALSWPAHAHGPQAHGPQTHAAHAEAAAKPADRRWLAGDHHVHSEFSVGWQADPANPQAPPTPIRGGDAIYPISKNVEMAAKFGLSWMVSTDHGGPNHSKVNAEMAYPEVLRAREATPGLTLFYGMEFDTPGADHSSLIIPKTPSEKEVLFSIERQFAKREPFPADPSWDAEPRMLDALRFMSAFHAAPVLIANHPARSATGYGEYGLDRPGELRDWNDAAPHVAVGMEGAPGHQASALSADGTLNAERPRGYYRQAATLGGFDQLSARLGGFWDSMLGEGRRWWITATSDSHKHYSEGGVDFWPGEYSKTYVHAAPTHADILDGLRHGRVFVTTGDLISELDLTLTSRGASASLGETLRVKRGADVTIRLSVRDPQAANAAGRTPDVARLDLISGDITGPAADRATDSHPSAKVLKRFQRGDAAAQGETLSVSHTLRGVQSSFYVRARGTNGEELEPTPDPLGEDPWSDLWFYANPVFVIVE